MTSYLLFTVGILVIVAPGIYCWMLLFPDDCAEQCIAWGSVLGIAAAVYLAYVCSLAHLSWFYAVWVVALVLSVGSIFVRPARRISKPSLPIKVAPGPATRIVLVLLLLSVAVLQIIVVTRHSLPDGWDPSFHLLLAKKLALSDHIIRDWQPFENAALNYPIGSHLLVALFARFSGLSLPLVFQLLMVAFGVLSALAVYTLAVEYFAIEIVGLYAAIAYTFWAFWGSTDYLKWGGLPNQLGMLMGLAILGLVTRSGGEKKRIGLMALLFASICLTHHHVMVTMGAILIALMLVFLLTRDTEKRYRTIFFALSLAGIGVAFYLVPYLLKAASLSQTKVFKMHDFVDFTTMGLVLIPFALLGIVLDYFRKDAGGHMFHIISVTLLLLYVLLGPVHYFYELQTTGQGLVAFTPSRFLSDLSYFFSLFAGYALYRIQRYFALSTAITVAIASLLGLTNLPLWKGAMITDRDRGRFAAYEWIQKHTPADSIVMTTDPYASFATWRRTLRTPMPVSEPRVAPRISEKTKVELVSGLSPKEIRGIPLLVVSGPGKDGKGKLLWSNPDGWRVTEVFAQR
jgi:hypothetical protein